MLQVQHFLKKNTPADLTKQYGINVYRHPVLPLFGMKYSQIESPKASPIVRECRGLVLEDGTNKVVAKGFTRFLNLGESREDDNKFDFNNFVADAKEDGSLMLVYFYNQDWHVNTSGSFGLGEVADTKKTWRQLFWEVFGSPNCLHGYEHCTLVFEYCSLYNKVVRNYMTPQLYLLGVFNNLTNEEYDPAYVTRLAKKAGLQRPQESHTFSASKDQNLARLSALIGEKEKSDPTFEGYVLRDKNGFRLKAKTQTYVNLHHMHDNGNIFLPKRLVPIVIAGEIAEVCIHFPELKGPLTQVGAEISKTEKEILDLWEGTKDIESQKEFAMRVKDHKFSGVLFTARKKKLSSAAEVSALFKAEPDKISQALFGDRTYEFMPR